MGSRTSEAHLVQTLRCTELSVRHYLATPDLRKQAHKLAKDVWKQHGDHLQGYVDRHNRRLQLAALRVMAALAAASAAIARELLHKSATMDGLKQLITSCERQHGQASEDETSDAVVRFVLALISSADRATLMQLLSLEHRRLVTLPMRLLPQLDGAAQAHVLAELTRCVLDEPTLPPSSKQVTALPLPLPLPLPLTLRSPLTLPPPPPPPLTLPLTLPCPCPCF